MLEFPSKVQKHINGGAKYLEKDSWRKYKTNEFSSTYFLAIK